MNKHSWLFVFTTWSLMFIMYVTFLRISINGNYSIREYIFGEFDKYIFTKLVSNRVNVFSLTRAFNVLSAVFFTSITLMINSYTSKSKKLVFFTPFTLFVILFSITYIIFYDPNFTLNLYIKICDNYNFKYIVYLLDLILHVIVYVILIYPIIKFIKNRKYFISMYKKRQIFGLSIYVILSGILYIILVNISSIRKIYFFIEKDNIIRINSYAIQMSREYFIYVVIMMIILISNFYITSKFNVFRNNGIIMNLLIKNQKRRMNKNFYQIFHGVKNIILSYRITVMKALNSPLKEKDEILSSLNEKMDDYLKHISFMLSSDSKIYGFYDKTVYASDIIKKVIEKLSMPEDIILEKNYTEKKEQLFVDSTYMVDAIYNIVENAVQAVEQNEGDKKISISIQNEFTWTVISISDNGPGMNRKTKRNIFEPFFTSKSRINNWGIGLYYTKNIIEQYNGNISIKSKPGVGTTFYVLLPTV